MQLRAVGVQLFGVNMKPVGEMAQPISIVAVLQAGHFRHERISVDQESVPLRSRVYPINLLASFETSFTPNLQNEIVRQDS